MKAGGAAKIRANSKTTKYASLYDNFHFITVFIEILEQTSENKSKGGIRHRSSEKFEEIFYILLYCILYSDIVNYCYCTMIDFYIKSIELLALTLRKHF